MENQMPQASAVAAAAPSSAESELPISNNAMAALGYLFAPFAIAALVMKQYQENAEVRFHAVHSLLLSATFIVGSICVGIITGIVTGIASMLFSALKLYGVMSVLFTAISGLTGLMSLACFAVWIVLIVTAANGKRFMTPFVGQMAEKMAKR